MTIWKEILIFQMEKTWGVMGINPNLVVPLSFPPFLKSVVRDFCKSQLISLQFLWEARSIHSQR